MQSCLCYGTCCENLALQNLCNKKTNIYSKTIIQVLLGAAETKDQSVNNRLPPPPPQGWYKWNIDASRVELTRSNHQLCLQRQWREDSPTFCKSIGDSPILITKTLAIHEAIRQLFDEHIYIIVESDSKVAILSIIGKIAANTDFQSS